MGDGGDDEHSHKIAVKIAGVVAPLTGPSIGLCGASRSTV
jgi:hypothetical protein